MLRRIFITIFLCLLCESGMLAQTDNDISGLMPVVHAHTQGLTQTSERGNDGSMISFLFYCYKVFISSQDGSSCTFIPSCSAYALECFRHESFLTAVWNFTDRFTRCNGLSPEQYRKDLRSGLLIDYPTNFYDEPVH